MDSLLNLFPELQLAGVDMQVAVLRCINQVKLAELESRNARAEAEELAHALAPVLPSVVS